MPARHPALLYLLMFLFGGLSLPLYGVFVALAGDQLESEELVAASRRILLLNGLGSALGPVAVSWLMAHVGNAVYGVFIAAVHLGAGALVLRSLLRERAVVVGQPAHYTAISPQTSVVAAEMAGRVAGEG